MPVVNTKAYNQARASGLSQKQAIAVSKPSVFRAGSGSSSSSSSQSQSLNDFSGKVEVSTNGQIEETQYFYKGKKVATSSKGGNTIVTDKSIKLEFGNKGEDVVINPGISRRQKTQDIVFVNGKGMSQEAFNKLRARKEQGNVLNISVNDTSKKRVDQKVFSAIENFSSKINSERERLRQQRLDIIKKEGLKTQIPNTLQSRKLQKIDQKLQGLAVVQTGTDFIASLPYLAKAGVNLIKNPKNIKNVPKALYQGVKEEGKEYVKLLAVSPNEAIAKIGAEIYLLKGTGKGLKVTGKVAENLATRIAPQFVGVAKKSVKLSVKSTKTAGKTVELQVAGKIGSKTLKRETLAEQVSLAGKRVNAISVQGDKLVGLIKDSKIIRKPIPNEAKLTGKAKLLLNKFDKGSINKSELALLDKLIKRQSGKGLLERSFFADPRGRIRPSRIGMEEEGSLIDLFSGKASLKSGKPQILLFEDVKVQKLPRSLKTIKKKLLNNKPLTPYEANKLLRFQLRKSGKFKPVGFLSGESEITLSPGELIKRQKKVGVTLINGKRVPIIAVRVVKATKTTKALLKKARLGKIGKSELRTLQRKLKRETGFKYAESSIKAKTKVYPIKRKLGSSLAISRKVISKKYVSPRARSKKTSSISTPRRKVSLFSKRVKYTKSGRPYVVTSSGARFISSSPKSPTKKSIPSKPRVSPKGSPRVSRYPIPRRRTSTKARKKIILSSKKRKIKSRPKEKEGFNVYARSKGKILKINSLPLSKKDALSRGTFAVDKSTSRTFFIKKQKGKVEKLGKVTKSERNYFNKNRPKLRAFKKRGSSRIKLSDKFIEKRKFLIDSRGEKRQLSLDRLAKQRGFIKSIPKRSKATPQQLKALKKARSVLAKKRR